MPKIVTHVDTAVVTSKEKFEKNNGKSENRQEFRISPTVGKYLVNIQVTNLEKGRRCR